MVFHCKLVSLVQKKVIWCSFAILDDYHFVVSVQTAVGIDIIVISMTEKGKYVI